MPRPRKRKSRAVENSLASWAHWSSTERKIVSILLGDEGELGDEVEAFGVGDGVAELGEVEGEGEERGELGGEGLGGGDADFGAGVGGDGALGEGA